jgi:[acyl-carrier-protein] S-malonyltransferase
LSKSAFLFPGQGAQYVGMGRQLIAESAAAREVYQRASQVLQFDFQSMCIEGPEQLLSTTDNSQPAIFVTSLAAAAVLRERDLALVEGVQAAAGLSLGEYTALVLAGCLDFDGGLQLVRTRGCAMQEASDLQPSGMVSILGLELVRVVALCDEVRQEGEVLQVANLLGPQNTAVSGHQAACDRISEKAIEAGAMKAIPLVVAGAFHTPLMQPAVEKLTAALGELTLGDAKFPVISNVDGRPHTDAGEIRDLLVQQVVRPVQWETTMRWLLEAGFDDFWEVGPGRVLRGLLRRINRKVPCENIPG